MSDDNKHTDEEKTPRKGEFRVPPRTWIVWVAIVGGLILLMLMKDRWESQADIVKQYKFQQLVESNDIVEATISYSAQNPFLNEVKGKMILTDEQMNRRLKDGKEVVIPFRAKVR